MKRPGMAALTAFLVSAVASAQGVQIGANLPAFAGNANPTATQTMITEGFSRANASGTVTTATFGWSATGCPAAVRIKFFRPVTQGVNPVRFEFLADRGPFDVMSPLRPGGGGPAVTQTVALVPPVAVQQGDVIAITNLTPCGGPTFCFVDTPTPLLPPSTAIYPGDVRSDITTAPASVAFPPVFV